MFCVGNADNSKFIKFDGSNFTVDAGNFSLDSSGNMTATSATLTGTVTAAAGSVGGFKLDSGNLFNDLTGANEATESNVQIFTNKSSPYIAMRRGFFNNASYPGGKIILGRKFRTKSTSVPHTFDGERIVIDGEDTSISYYSGSGDPTPDSPIYPRKFKIGANIYDGTSLESFMTGKIGAGIAMLPGAVFTSASIIVDNSSGNPAGPDDGAGWSPSMTHVVKSNNLYGRGAVFTMKRDVATPQGNALNYLTSPDIFTSEDIIAEQLTSAHGSATNYQHTANLIVQLSGSEEPYQGNSTTDFDNYPHYNLYSAVYGTNAIRDGSKHFYSGFFGGARFQVSSSVVHIGNVNGNTGITGSAGFSSTISAPSIGTGVDNSVVVLDSDGTLRTDEIDSYIRKLTISFKPYGPINFQLRLTKWADQELF